MVGRVSMMNTFKAMICRSFTGCSLGVGIILGVLLSASQACGASRKIEMGVIPGGLKYNITEFQVSAGESVEFVFNNNGLIPHNWLLTRPGKLDDVIAEAMALGVDGLAKDFIPDSSDILHSVALVQPGKSVILQFTAPDAVGDYPYVCTFPGHFNLMRGVMKVVGKETEVLAPSITEGVSHQILNALGRSGVEPFPKGTKKKPYVIRTFMPEPNLDPAIFAQHQRGYAAANYSPATGTDVPGIARTDQGLPAAFGVNFGDELSYCWDTVECRLMYVWTGDFLDMSVYWGGGAGGGRKGFDYVPRIMGNLRFKTQGEHPINANFNPAQPVPSPRFRGYRVVDGYPEFHYTVDGLSVRERISPEDRRSFRVDLSIASDNDSSIRLAFDTAIRPSLQASHGIWEGDELVLTPDEAVQFNLVQRF